MLACGKQIEEMKIEFLKKIELFTESEFWAVEITSRFTAIIFEKSKLFKISSANKFSTLIRCWNCWSDERWSEVPIFMWKIIEVAGKRATTHLSKATTKMSLKKKFQQFDSRIVRHQCILGIIINKKFPLLTFFIIIISPPTPLAS